jgi:hypothetical protein
MADTGTTKVVKSKRRGRWIRRLLILALLLVGGYFVVMQSFVTRWIVMGQVGRLVGGKATASQVILSPSGRIVIRDGKLRAPDIPGEAGTVFSVKRLEAEFSWSSLLGGGLAVHRIRLDEPLARVSQSVDDGTVNIAALKPRGAASPPREVPKVIVNGGVIELGEHVTDAAKLAAGVPQYMPLKRIDVGGEVLESPEQGAKVFSFHEIEGAKPVPGGLAVTGRISQQDITLTLAGLSLSTWTAESAPTPTRELFRQAAMQGEIPRATIKYSYSGGWEAKIDLKNVAVNLPVTARPDEDDNGNPLPQSEADKKRLLRMEQVNGQMVFTNKGVDGALKGSMEELPYEVNFHVDGTSFDSPFTCTLESKGFELTKKPQIMKFAPGVARRRLDQFNNPTGTVDAKVTVSRGAPVKGKEADVDVTGEIHFRDVTAAFEKFPYRFSKMTGEVTFDSNRVDLVSIDGQAEGGVRVHATGVIAPPTDAAGVDLDIHVTNIPVDERLRQAMLGRRRVLDALFSEQRYQELLDAGLVATTEQHNKAEAALGSMKPEQLDSEEAVKLRAVARRPVFELGGRAEVRVQIHRAVGIDAEWEDVETITLADAGVLPERVPYPLLADQVVIVKQDTLAKVEGGVYRGLTGGLASVEAYADFSKVDDPKLPFVPDVTIEARDVPVDPLLINCLPESEQLSGSGAGSLHQMLTDLHAVGLVDCDVRLGMDAKNEPYFKVDTTLKDLIARPHAKEKPARVMLSQMAGKVTVTQDDLKLGITATAGSADGQSETSGATVQFWMPITAPLSDLSAPKPAPDKGLTLTASAPQLDSSLPVEDLVSIFAPGPGKNIGDLRAKLEPYGAVDVAVSIAQQAPGAETVTKVDCSNPHGFEVTALGGRLGMQSATGKVTITSTSGPGPGVITAHDIGGVVIFQGDPVGEAGATGSIATDWSNAPGSAGLAISLKDGRFECPLSKSAAKDRGATMLGELLEKAEVKGRYELDLTLGGPPAPGSKEARSSGVLRPKTLQMVMNGTPVAFSEVSGAVEFSGTDGRLRGLHVKAPEWSAGAEGSWIGVPGGNKAVQTTLTMNSTGLPPDLLAVLPEDLKAVFDDLKFTAAGPVELSDAQLSMTFGDQGEVAAFKSSGKVTLRGGKMDVGATVERLEGTLDYTVSRTTAGVPVEFELWALLDGFSLSGVSMTNGRVRAASGAGREVLVPLISADCHGGRVAGTATIGPPENGKRRYEVQLQASNVRFASVLSDFQSVAPQDPTQTPLRELADESRGRLDMGVSLAGIANDPDSRRGRGTATVGGGRIVNIPLLVPLVRITNLQLPIDERLDYAYADFYVDARQVIFNEVSISSRSVAVFGYGMATLPDLALSLKFASKSRSRIPVLTGIFEYLRNELATVVVTGTLSEPRMSVVPLSSASRVLGRMFKGEPTQQQRTMDQIERRADQNARRPQREGAVEPR